MPKKPSEKVLPGRTYGRWEVLQWLTNAKSWECRCECGREVRSISTKDLLANAIPMCRLCAKESKKPRKKKPDRKHPPAACLNGDVPVIGLEKLAEVGFMRATKQLARPVKRFRPYHPLPTRVAFLAGEEPMTKAQWTAFRVLIKELSIHHFYVTNMTENERTAQKVVKQIKPRAEVLVASSKSNNRNKRANPRSVGTQNCRFAIVIWPMDEMVAKSAHMSRTKKARFYFLFPDGSRKFLRRLDDEHDIEQQRRDRLAAADEVSSG